MLGWLLSFDCQHGAVAQKVPGIKVTFAVWFSNRLSQRDTDQLPSNHPRRLFFRLNVQDSGIQGSLLAVLCTALCCAPRWGFGQKPSPGPARGLCAAHGKLHGTLRGVPLPAAGPACGLFICGDALQSGS